ncbi:hypothetical protein DB88DRAFT_443220 [Papiliotrema laurentii]|uniref:Methyltransferase small domain-containing protein n=1 Tax=Papiliotrema laurentii TaxID=5418 RepID=A0AAD9CY48_PAPLA|nr:hypothetical protein DB88DRAFT_443220 [Papiliotrema laurentii]
MATSIPTPQIAHFTEEDYRDIYEPAEDSFILLDALEKDADLIRLTEPTLSVEIGSGSGIVSAFISHLIRPGCTAHVATDINEKACAATLRTAQANTASLDALRCHLVGPLFDRVQGQIDLLVFNPPYVPTDEDEQRLRYTQEDQGIGGAWAGGHEGMVITERVLDIVPSLLSTRGRFYLVTIEQNNPSAIMQRMESRLDSTVSRSDSYILTKQIVLRRRAGRELLSVICFTLKGTQNLS